MLIGEVAKRSGLTRDTVRFYEEKGLVWSGTRPAGSRLYNVYEPDVLERLAFIKQAQNIGYTLREIKYIMDEWGTDPANYPLDDMIRFLEDKLQRTEEQLEHLEGVRGYLIAKLERLRSAEGAECIDAIPRSTR